MSEYTGLQRLLHHVALTNATMLEAAFDAELAFCKSKIKEQELQQHVFVSGLARGGTTVLMRSLYASQQFASLTYADMPFVLAPNLWYKISGKSRKTVEAKERAHGDGILVDFNSPEALDEVFWRAFAWRQYVHKNHIVPHGCNAELLEKYKQYIAVILHRYGSDRYLSKNNNNILRLDCICRAFPGALILIPFRDPVQHANSLLRQHILFSEKQQKDKFVRRYMTWLGHFEFGLGHKPFKLNGSLEKYKNTLKIEYWLQQWRNLYKFLLDQIDNHPENTLCISYERLCADTEAMWESLCNRLNIKDSKPPSMGAVVRKTPTSPDKELLAEVYQIYERLSERCNDSLYASPS